MAPKKTPIEDNYARMTSHPFPIAGIGASAGGLEAFTELLKALPADTGMGFVLVQHLDPVHESALTHLLTRATAMPVYEVEHDLRVLPNHIYVIPPNKNLALAQGVLKLLPRSKTGSRSIDHFFQSLAEDQHERAIGVVLSGTGSDGTLGLEAIKAEGGITFAQDDSAKFEGMPHSAIVAGCVDFALTPQDIARELARIAQHPYVLRASVLPAEAEREADQRGGPHDALAAGGHGTPPTGSITARREANAAPPGAWAHDLGGGFKKILSLLHTHCGIDFSLYKSNTIQRRILRRLVLNKIHTLEDYAHFLRGNTAELDALYSDVLISVTSFFRNPEAFETLKLKVFPKILQRRGEEPVRVWTVGCSTGQEAYSLAMAFMESCDKLTRAPKLQLFATDLNEALLDKARHGLYTKSLTEEISPERLRRFFVEEDGGYRITKALRETVVFARQNLLYDPPFSRMDLISCRNLLIYFDSESQKKTLPIFHYALKPEGFLFLGAAESVGTFSDLFEITDKKQKIYSKKPGAVNVHQIHLAPSRATVKKAGVIPKAQTAPEGFHAELNAQREADRITLNQFAPPGVLINADLQILQFRGDTSPYLKPPTGKASFNLLKMAGEELLSPLRAAVRKAMKEDCAVRKEKVRVTQNGAAGTVSIEVVPLKNLKERCYLIWFEPTPSATARALAKLEAEGKILAQRESRFVNKNEERRRIAELERELAETLDYLQTLQEQSEAVNEELQASSEEMQSANEELQSINEELETSKEEIESTNEELTTVNDEMVHRNADLSRLNSDLSNFIASVNMAIVVLGRDLTIRRFTPLAEQSFNLRPTDVGQPLARIRHNLDCPDLEQFISAVISTLNADEREVRDKRGHWYALRARPYLSLDNKVDGAVVVLVDIDELKRGEQGLVDAHAYAQAILEETPPLLVLDPELRVMSANTSFYKHFNVAPAETEQRLIYSLGNDQWNIPALRTLLEEILPRNSFFKDFEVTHEFPHLGRRTMLLSAQRVTHLQRIFLGIRDITEQVKTQTALRASEMRYRRLFEAAKDGVLIINPENRKIIDVNPYLTELLGRAREHFLGKALWEIGLREDQAADMAAFEQLQQTGYIHYETLAPATQSGECRAVEIVGNLYQEDGHAVIQCNIRDITERKKLEDTLRHNAAHDALTGLPNKALFLELVNHAVGRAARRADYLFAVLFLDLDRFKVINDSLGHLAGDQLLVEITRRLNVVLRPGDTLGRFGGDEFTILLEDIQDSAEVVQVVERLQKELDAPFTVAGQTVHTSASIGITLSTHNKHSAEDIVRDADIAMYRAKALGRAGYEFSDQDTHSYALKLWELECDLRRGIEQQEFFIYYQPVVSLASGKINSVEALIRWQHPQRGVVSPEEFIPLAEETGLIKLLGTWLLHTACAQLQAWHQAGYSGLSISVNCSVLQFHDKNLAETIRGIFAEVSVSLNKLILEITESVAMKHTDTSMAILLELNAMGVQIAIDDFGTGYSSLSYLRRFPISTLKIDRSFVQDMTHDGHNTEISAAIIAMAHNLKLEVVAEGVETEQQLALLHALHCDGFQGFLLSKPLPAQEVLALLQKDGDLLKDRTPHSGIAL